MKLLQGNKPKHSVGDKVVFFSKETWSDNSIRKGVLTKVFRQSWLDKLFREPIRYEVVYNTPYHIVKIIDENDIEKGFRLVDIIGVS